MFTSTQKNSFLQLECSLEPRLINKAVKRAMRKKQIDPRDEIPPAKRLESMQPSLFAPWMDITRAHIGFERVGLRILNRELHSEDPLVQRQALHSILDQVQISENALFLINLNVTYRLISLISDPDALIREKVILILIHIANYYQGKVRIMSHPGLVEHFVEIFLHDCKEIRYIAALFLKTLTRDKSSSQIILKNERIVETLLMVIQNEHSGIIILYLNILKNLAELDPARLLKANAFQIMRNLMKVHDSRIVTGGMECMLQLCKHHVGKSLADKHDMIKVLQTLLLSSDIQVIISAVGLLSYITLTPMSKWRSREIQWDLIKRLVTLCIACSVPSLQIRSIQVLINLCESPDIREHVNNVWRDKIDNIKVKTHEQWDGTTETTTFGLKCGHNYRTMCIEDLETVKNDYGDNANVVNVHSFLSRVRDAKQRLIKILGQPPLYYETTKKSKKLR